MLGNTNVKDGINLNATIVTKEVESGQSIVAGNFVQYKTVSCDIEIGSTTIISIADIGDGYYLAVYSDNVLKLLKFDGANSEVVDTYTDFPVYNVTADQDGNIYATSKISSNDYLYRFAIENNVITRKANVKLDTYAGSDAEIYVVGGYIYTIKYSSAGTPHLYVNVLTDNGGTLTKVTTQDDTSSTYRQYAGGIVIGGYAYRLYQTTDSSYKYLNCAITSFSSSGVSVRVETLLDRVPIGQSHGWGLSTYAKYDNGIMITKDEDIAILDTRMNVLTYPCSFDFSIMGGKLHQIENNKILVTGTKMCIAEFDSELVRVNQLSNTVTPTNATTYRENDDEFIYFTGGQTLSVYNYSDDYLSLSQPIDIDYVRNWDGNYRLIGVAKQSGTAGDTIEVYIPSV